MHEDKMRKWYIYDNPYHCRRQVCADREHGRERNTCKEW